MGLEMGLDLRSDECQAWSLPQVLLGPSQTGFKYCRAVPKDLQSIEGKQAWVKYLGPVSRAVAETMAHGLAFEHGRRILALRGGAAEGDPKIGGVLNLLHHKLGTPRSSFGSRVEPKPMTLLRPSISETS